MARKKSKPIVAHDTPSPPPSSEVKLAVDPMATMSGAFSSTSASPTRPTHLSSFPVMCETVGLLSDCTRNLHHRNTDIIQGYHDHVATCTRPSTANNGTSSSSLSPPPPSPASFLPSLAQSIAAAGSSRAATKEVPSVLSQSIPANESSGASETGDANAQVILKTDSDPIRPYLNPLALFDYYEYYDQAEVAEEAETEPQYPNLLENPDHEELELGGVPPKSSELVERLLELAQSSEIADASENPTKLLVPKKDLSKKPEAIQKYPFPQFTPLEVFENYIHDVEGMSYDELYHRTAKVAGTLATYQSEWDAIDEEIFAHETILKAEAKRAEDDAKEAVEEQRLLDDAARKTVAEIYEQQLKFPPREFQAFLAEFEENHPSDSDTPRHLQNLKNPQFMALVDKRQRLAKNKEDRLKNAPYPEIKPTKDEIALEKRKRGRLMDPVKFDDMKTADVYGFEYSSHVKHYGAQPLSDKPRRSQTKAHAKQLNGYEAHSNGIETGERGRTRTQRNKTKRLYEADLSGSPESEEDGLPAKRARKPKIFEDGIDLSGKARAAPASRSGTPPVRTFASGKRVGRPPAKSKLQAVQMAPRSQSPHSHPDGGANGANGQESEIIVRDLGPLAAAHLHGAAQSLIGQTVSDDTVSAPPLKKKHAGGRPRKHPLPSADITLNTTVEVEPASAPKPKNKGGRPRKTYVPEDSNDTIKIEAAPQYENNVLQSTEQAYGSPESTGSDLRTPKRKRTSADSDQSPIVVDPAPLQAADPPPKRRRSRAPKAAFSVDEELQGSSDGKVKRKRDDSASLGAMIPVFKKRKARGEGVLSFPTEASKEEEDSDADIDEESLDPVAREALRLKRIKKEKSRKLSHSMKMRWANGGMQEAQETRRANNEAKKKARRAEIAQIVRAGPAGVPNVPPINMPVPTIAPRTATSSTSSTAPDPTPKTTVARPKVKRESSKKAKSLPPPPRRTSSRPRKPRVLGFDGADDDDEDDEEDDEIEKQFASEYDHYQALTSPGGQGLGKRARKPMVDLTTVAYTSDDTAEDFEDDWDY